MDIVEKLRQRLNRLGFNQAYALYHLDIAASLYPSSSLCGNVHCSPLLLKLAFSAGRTAILGTIICTDSDKFARCSIPNISLFAEKHESRIEAIHPGAVKLIADASSEFKRSHSEKLNELRQIRDKAIAHQDVNGNSEPKPVPDFNMLETKRILLGVNTFCNTVVQPVFNTTFHPNYFGMDNPEDTVFDMCARLRFDAQTEESMLESAKYDDLDAKAASISDIAESIRGKVLKSDYFSGRPGR